MTLPLSPLNVESDYYADWDPDFNSSLKNITNADCKPGLWFLLISLCRCQRTIKLVMEIWQRYNTFCIENLQHFNVKLSFRFVFKSVESCFCYNVIYQSFLSTFIWNGYWALSGYEPDRKSGDGCSLYTRDRCHGFVFNKDTSGIWATNNMKDTQFQNRDSVSYQYVCWNIFLQYFRNIFICFSVTRNMENLGDREKIRNRDSRRMYAF